MNLTKFIIAIFGAYAEKMMKLLSDDGCITIFIVKICGEETRVGFFKKMYSCI
jgi:hypothetical protein